MKKSVILLFALFCGVSTAASQDLIVKRDSARIEARVTEISPESVRYKRFSNPDGPTYVLPVSDIRRIEYSNGEKEFFGTRRDDGSGRSAGVQPILSAVQPTPPAVPAEDVNVYEVGDYYDVDGVRGVVCQLSDGGRHGLILSLHEAMLPWSHFDRKDRIRAVGAADRRDGSANMQAVEKYIAANGLSWGDFPAFEWCRQQGEGWYLPAVDEILVIGHLYNGGTRLAGSRQARNRFNDMLREHAGERMDRMVYYFSSTESGEKNALTSHMATDPPYVNEVPKHNKFLVRAVHKF